MKVKVELGAKGSRSLERVERLYEMDTKDLGVLIKHIEAENEGFFVAHIIIEEE